MKHLFCGLIILLVAGCATPVMQPVVPPAPIPRFVEATPFATEGEIRELEEEMRDHVNDAFFLWSRGSKIMDGLGNLTFFDALITYVKIKNLNLPSHYNLTHRFEAIMLEEYKNYDGEYLHQFLITANLKEFYDRHLNKK